MAEQYKAKQMKPVDIYALNHSKSDSTPQFKATMDMKTKPPKKPMKGMNPKMSEMDGPYGGKKPQGKPGGMKK
jgi:hypothetical protein